MLLARFAMNFPASTYCFARPYLDDGLRRKVPPLLLGGLRNNCRHCCETALKPRAIYCPVRCCPCPFCSTLREGELPQVRRCERRDDERDDGNFRIIQIVGL